MTRTEQRGERQRRRRPSGAGTIAIRCRLHMTSFRLGRRFNVKSVDFQFQRNIIEEREEEEEDVESWIADGRDGDGLG